MGNWFVFPENAIWLLSAPVAVVLIWASWRRSRNLVRYWFGNDPSRDRVAAIRTGFRLAGLILLFPALLGPWWGRRLEMINHMGREIFFLIDVSASMNAEDIKPSRLEKVKSELRKVLPDLQGDRVGLIIFTENAYVQCPLTEDAGALNLFVDLITTEQFTDQGTNFREALLAALTRFNEETQEGLHTRCVVLLSDGENFGDNYTSVVNRMSEKGIKVFPVGVGTEAGARVPKLYNGVKEGYITDDKGEEVISRINETSLRELADDFGTVYHRIGKSMDDLSPVLDQLSMQTASVMNSRAELTSVNRFQWPLGISVLLLGVSFFMLPTRRTEKEN